MNPNPKIGMFREVTRTSRKGERDGGRASVACRDSTRVAAVHDVHRGENAWFMVTFAVGGSPIVRFRNPFPTGFRFDVYTGCNLVATLCTQDFRAALGRFYCEVASGTYLVRVYRPLGPVTCDSVTLDIQN